MIWVLCALGGLVAGVLSGLLGIGGGIIVVPLLIYLLPFMGIPPDLVAPMAVATSLATIVVTSLSGAYVHHRHGAVLWHWVRVVAPLLIAGGIAGSFVGASLNPELLQRLLALILILLAARMVIKQKPGTQNHAPPTMLIRLWSGVIGMISTLVGIGGGALVVPMLNFYRIALRNAVAIAAVCSVLLALFGTITYAWLGSQGEAGDIPGAFGFIYMPAWLGIAAVSVIAAPCGARLAQHVPIHWLKRMFALLLVVVAIHLFMNV